MSTGKARCSDRENERCEGRGEKRMPERSEGINRNTVTLSKPSHDLLEETQNAERLDAD
jgi:hypothetical protein